MMHSPNQERGYILIDIPVTRQCPSGKFALGNAKDGQVLRVFQSQRYGWNRAKLQDDLNHGLKLVTHADNRNVWGQLLPSDAPGLFGNGGNRFMLSYPVKEGLRNAKLCFRESPKDPPGSVNVPVSTDRSPSLSIPNSNEPDPLDLSLSLSIPHSNEPDPLDLTLRLSMGHSSASGSGQ
jgi:hypothetical protein